MPTFILLTRLSPQALQQPKSLEMLEQDVSQQVLDKCPRLKWLSSHALLGPWNYMDVIEAPDMENHDAGLAAGAQLRQRPHRDLARHPMARFQAEAAGPDPRGMNMDVDVHRRPNTQPLWREWWAALMLTTSAHIAFRQWRLPMMEYKTI